MWVINTTTNMKMGVIMNNKEMMIKMNAAITFGFSETPPRETVKVYSQPATHLPVSLTLFNLYGWEHN